MGDLHLLNLTTLDWSEAASQDGSVTPSPQADAALAWAQGKLFLFGGESTGDSAALSC